MLAILEMLVISPSLMAMVVEEARRLRGTDTAPPSPAADGVIEQKLQQLQQAYVAEILTRAEYERKRKALLASARTPLVSAAVNEARALSILADISALMTAAAPSERRAVVGALFDKIWIQAKGVVAITPRADVGPVLVGLSQVRYGCLDRVPDGHQ